MSDENRVSAAITEQTVTDVLDLISQIKAKLPFLLSRAEGDNSVMLGDKSAGFDEKSGTYMASHPEFLPNLYDIAEVNKDRAVRPPLKRILIELALLHKMVEDTYNVAGNELMLANIAYYNQTGAAAALGRPAADDIHKDLSSRFPGRPRKPAAPAGM